MQMGTYGILLRLPTWSCAGTAGTRSRNRRQPQQNAPIQAHGDTNGIEDGQSTMQQENGMHERPIPEQTFF